MRFNQPAREHRKEPRAFVVSASRWQPINKPINAHNMKTTKNHITIQLRKIYNAALSKSNDPLDCGRRELAWELIRGNAEFLADHFPDYSSSASIARIDDLSKIVSGDAYIDGEDSAAAQLLDEEFGGDAEHPSILERLINLEASCLLVAHS